MIQQGDRVRHSSDSATFGTGTVLEVNEQSETALIEWDAHEVDREGKKLTKHQSHVNISSLVPISQ